MCIAESMCNYSCDDQADLVFHSVAMRRGRPAFGPYASVKEGDDHHESSECERANLGVCSQGCGFDLCGHECLATSMDAHGNPRDQLVIIVLQMITMRSSLNTSISHSVKQWEESHS